MPASGREKWHPFGLQVRGAAPAIIVRSGVGGLRAYVDWLLRSGAVPAEQRRRRPRRLAEHVREMAVAGKAEGERDVRDRRAVRQQHLPSLPNPPLGNVAAGRLAEGRLEGLAEMMPAQSGFRGERREPDILLQMRLDEVGDPPPARGAETAPDRCRALGAFAMGLEQAQDERRGGEVQVEYPS